MVERGWRARRAWPWLGLAGLGVAVCAGSLILPWHQDDFRLAAGTRILMASTGVVLLVVVARWRGRAEAQAAVTMAGVLGGCLLVYPSLLAVAAAGIGAPAVSVLASAFHVIPLTLVQLGPVLASSLVLRRRSRRWEWTIVGVAAASTGITGLAVAGVGQADLWAAVSTATFVASFALAPIATWTAVPGVRGETRRRAILAAVSSLFPVAIIAGCTALGVLASGVNASDDLAVTILLTGFSLGSLFCGLAMIATTAPSGSAVLRTRVIVTALDALGAILVLIVGGVVALVLPAVVTPGWALLAGGVAAIALLVPWLRLRTWIARVIDPSAELRHELSVIGAVRQGQQRQTIVLVLRRLHEDPGLELSFRVGADAWAGVDGRIQSPPVDAIVLASRDGEPSVLARPGHPEAAARLAALGDITPALQPALLEAMAVHEADRAGRAASEERRQLERDLHDGLQGRLLGLALNLQLSGREVDDPSARLLLEETVRNLRSTVDDVRALGRGRQPELLAEAGLAPALSSLFAYARPVVELDVAEGRFAAEAETTAYFVVGEAVANALKHAGARTVRVVVRADEARVSVTVSDDGCGGADPRLGSGLRGLAERVAATGGALVVRDLEPTGTVVEAVVPCGS